MYSSDSLHELLVFKVVFSVLTPILLRKVGRSVALVRLDDLVAGELLVGVGTLRNV